MSDAVPSPTPNATPDLTSSDAILKWIVSGFVRHLATVAGGALVAHGFASSSDLQTVIGALIALGMIAWSGGEKIAVAEAHSLALLAAAEQAKRLAEISAARAPAVAAPVVSPLDPHDHLP